MNPPTTGLDASWNAGLAMAIHDNLQFGKEVVFTYGPLGFLQGQFVWYSNLAVIAFLYSAGLYIVFCTALVWALRRALPIAPAVVIAFLIIAVLPLPEQSILVAVLVCMSMLECKRSERAINVLVVAGASFAAVEALVKLSMGPVIAIVFLIALLGAGARWWKVLTFAFLFLAELLGLWLLAGQSLSAVPAFSENTLQIISGYSEAMLRQVDVSAWKVLAATVVAAIVAIALVAASAGTVYPNRRARWSGIALMAIAAFAVFKEGLVRTDAGHLSLYFSTACVLWIAVPWSRTRWHWMVAGAGAIAVIGIPVRPHGLPTNLNPVANLNYAVDQGQSLLNGSRLSELIQTGRAAMKSTYRLNAQMLAALYGHTVAVEPWEIGAAWAYRLDWAPLPIFQNYQAYTSKLDHLNAIDVESQHGPERILRENQLLVDPEFPTPDLDNRYLGWDPPAQARAVLCHFIPLHTTDRWQVLGRTANRCTQPRYIRSVNASSETAVRVPKAARGEFVFVRIYGAGVGGLERISTLLLHAQLRTLVVNHRRAYRLIPGTASDGLLLRATGSIAEGGPFSRIPQAKSIAVTGTSADLRFSFFRVRMRDARSAGRAYRRSGYLAR